VLAAGIRLLPLAEPTVRRLEAMGYRRGMIRQAKYPELPDRRFQRLADLRAQRPSGFARRADVRCA
jgi:hypothetical protein